MKSGPIKYSEAQRLAVLSDERKVSVHRLDALCSLIAAMLAAAIAAWLSILAAYVIAGIVAMFVVAITACIGCCVVYGTYYSEGIIHVNAMVEETRRKRGM